MSAARKSAYASTTHCTSATVAFRSVWSTGKATLTTVLSIKAILDPRMVSTSTHVPADCLAGRESFPDRGVERITPSSHGCFTTLIFILAGNLILYDSCTAE